MITTVNEHKFNDDLLANEDDRKAIRELYPTMEHVLYHEELIDYFTRYNGRADAAKRMSRKWGKWAIAGAATAVSLAAVEIVAESEHQEWAALAIGIVAAVCGVASVLVGAIGVLFGSRKREWLHNRFMGERIRQFHFQSLIALMPQIIASLSTKQEENDSAKGRFRSDRRQLFLHFQNQFDGSIDSKFTGTIGADGEKGWWLCGTQNTSSTPDQGKELEPLFAAYRELRIIRQLGYANYKLQSDHKVFSTLPIRQAEILDTIGKIGIAWLFLIHLIVLGIVLVAITALVTTNDEAIKAIKPAVHWITIVFGVAIIIIAVISLSARAFQQGLQPEREIERYRQYRSAVQAILVHFDDADTPNRKVSAMKRMERLAFDEMRNFLHTYDRSSFAM